MLGSPVSLGRMLVGSVVSLWLLDVLVNLELAEEFVLDDRAVVSWSDYVGLFLAEILAALLAVALSWTLARLIHGKAMEGAVPILSATHSGLVVLPRTSMLWASLTALLVWLGIRFLWRGGSKRRPGKIVAYVVFPPLVVGYVQHALEHGGRQAGWSGPLVGPSLH